MHSIFSLAMKACLELQSWNLHCILGPSTSRLFLNSCFNGDLENILNERLNTFPQFLQVSEWYHTLHSRDHSLSLTGLPSKAQRSLNGKLLLFIFKAMWYPRRVTVNRSFQCGLSSSEWPLSSWKGNENQLETSSNWSPLRPYAARILTLEIWGL